MKGYQKLLKTFGFWKEEPKVEVIQEEVIFNPLGARVGGAISINSIDYKDVRFRVKSINEHSIHLNKETHQIADYLLADVFNKNSVKLRVISDLANKNHDLLVLNLYDEMSYSEDFHNVLKDESKKFVIDNDDDPENVLHEEFWRVNDVKSSYLSDVKMLVDTNNDGKIEGNEITNSQIEFWDYSRMTDLDGVEAEEFVFVELDKENGWFQIWKGFEIIAEKISVF